MPTESSQRYIPGMMNFPDTRLGRFGTAASGFGPNRGLSYLHKGGMHGAGSLKIGGLLGDLGLGEQGLFDFGSYQVGSRGRTLGWAAGRTRAGMGAAAGTMAEARSLGMRAGRLMRRGTWGMRGQLLAQAGWRSIGPAVTGFAAYQGYQEGGVAGAVKETAKMLAFDYALGFGLRAAGIAAAPLAVGAAIAGAGYGSYKLLEAGRQRMKRTRRLEMGSPIVDPFGNGATMRQRSLQALQGSQLNGRSALGSEAQIFHTSMMR